MRLPCAAYASPRVSLNGADRPCAPQNCTKCAGCRKLPIATEHTPDSGKSKASRNARSIASAVPGCGHTWSVIPADMARAEAWSLVAFSICWTGSSDWRAEARKISARHRE
ncbi:MAG: hypothetical protein WC765_05395 [Phycisphaerae bacterium]